MPKFSKLFCFLLFFVALNLFQAQQTISLEECYDLARENYPAVKKLGLLAKIAEFEVQNIQKKYLPQVSLSGQATYQSETVRFPDAFNSSPLGLSLPSLNKDQYKIQGEINQLLFDGGNLENQKKLIQANSELQKQTVENSLYALKQRINSLYFSVLLLDAQKNENLTLRSTLQTQVQKMTVALQNGVAFRSNVDELKAEVLNVEMANTELAANRSANLKMLSMLTGKDFSENAVLEIPENFTVSEENKRPELRNFVLQKNILDLQEKQLKTDLLPKINAFFQGAYGRPTLNFLENKFGPWFIAGLRLNWSLDNFYTNFNKKELVKLNRENIEVDRDLFLLNTTIEAAQQTEFEKKYQNLLELDKKAIELRNSVTKSAEAQLANGVITVHEYIQKVNAENLARQTMFLHQIEFLQAKYNQKFITGN